MHRIILMKKLLNIIMKLLIKRYFNNVTQTYDNSANIQQIIADELAANIPAKYFENVLEIGTGTGFLTKRVIQKIQSAFYLNIDLAFELLLSYSKQTKNMFFVNADADYLPIKKNNFDLLISSSTFQWLEKPEKSFDKIFNSLKDEGEFYFSIFGSGTFFEMNEISKVTGFGSVMPMLSEKDYENIFKKSSIDFEITTKNYILFYDSVLKFLKHHKKTGARYTSKNKTTGKKSFNAFCQLYKDLFGTEKGIPVSYSIIYIKGYKK